MSQNQSGSSDSSDRPVPQIRGPRAFRIFRNPPQPHMCIRDTTREGSELFINVLSWNKIAMPRSSQDPIPLYGGMKVPPASSNTPPLVFAVMANPDILKTNGRSCPDPAERMALVELMCDFVEAMNPGLVMKRQPIVLPEREISGELKDVWTAVQIKREREREREQTDVQHSTVPYLNNSSQSNSNLKSPNQNVPAQTTNSIHFTGSCTSESINIDTQYTNSTKNDTLIIKSDAKSQMKIKIEPCPLSVTEIDTQKHCNSLKLVDPEFKLLKNNIMLSNGCRDFFPNFQSRPEENTNNGKCENTKDKELVLRIDAESKLIETEIKFSKLNLKS